MVSAMDFKLDGFQIRQINVAPLCPKKIYEIACAHCLFVGLQDFYQFDEEVGFYKDPVGTGQFLTVICVF